jgi:hypothetical protein
MALYAQDYNFLPKEGKVLKFKGEVKSPMQSEPMVTEVSQYVEKISDNEYKTVVETKSESNAEANQKQEVVYKIDGDRAVVNMKDVLDQQLAQTGGTAEIVEQKGDFSYPVNITKDSKLEPVYVTLKMNVQGMDLDMEMSYDNRVIEGEEVVKVPAGEFTCLKISEELVILVMGQEQITKLTYWIAKGVGPVKQNVSAMGGMVESTQELVAIEDK